MQLEEWLDDLCVRFIINLPDEEANNVERLCFQVEEAQWFYEDFIRPLDPRLPSLSLKAFSLRIFQHCPVFRQWDAHHRTQAFADFMAYKQRVPVRGAIMLNAAMDKVVLVKGWKKGANWSFPRGKINKDENDLDCAVREVYEETGFDIAAAGLVKDEKEMKSIDITMREQHMRLYVFRGVPEDTHFEPRTRKEISKIEWYRLTDLPTLGKHKHADSNGNGNGNGNGNDNDNNNNRPSPSKFYMVAPFLGPLKKWIHQQRKKDGSRHSSSLAAPPMIAEGSADDAPSDQPTTGLQQPQKPSDLPEVTVPKPDNAAPSQLAQLFGISPSQSQAQQQQQPPPHLHQADAAKSTALLSLLRSPTAAEIGASPNPPILQPSPFPSAFPVQTERPKPAAPTNEPWPHGPTTQEQPHTLLHHPSGALTSFPPFQGQGFANASHVASRPPYQLTGDPQFARPQQQEINAPPAVPPASALPKLTHHTKTLLDMFSTKLPAGPPPAQHTPAATRQTLLDVFQNAAGGASNGRPPLASGPVAAILNQQKQPTFANVVSAPPQGVKPDAAPTAQLPSTARQQDLLGLFGAPAPATQVVPPPVEQPRAELAATPEHQARNDDALLALLRKQKAEQAATQRHPGSTSKEGKTSANMSGPLDQPNFDVVARAHKVDPNGIRRSPLAANRTLFDPSQPTRVKVMARSESPRQPASSRSPRAPKAKMPPPSPKRHAKPSPKEQAKPFQPQILKRPQTSEGPPSSEPAAKALSMSREASASSERPLAQNTASASIAPVNPQKQVLLSLFGGGGSPSSTSTAKTAQTPTRMVSPLSMSQIVSSKSDAPISGIEPAIPTRPRGVEPVVSAGSPAGVGSGVGASAGPARPGLEKRQTAAEDKAFLLGMLGKIAQEQS